MAGPGDWFAGSRIAGAGQRISGQDGYE